MMYCKVSKMKPDFHTAFLLPLGGPPVGVQVYMCCRSDQDNGHGVKIAISIQILSFKSTNLHFHRSIKTDLVQMHQ